MQPVPFDALNFGANNGGVWTVRPEDQITYEYAVDPVLGLVTVNYVIGNTNVAGSPTALYLKLPAGVAAFRRVEPLMYYTDGDEVKRAGYSDVNPSVNGDYGRRISFVKFDLQPWKPTSGHNTAVHGSAQFSLA